MMSSYKSIGTNQACLFRDSYEPLTKSGFAIYGLSSDSPKANTTFKTKQNLPYPLLCDPGLHLISAIKLKKAPKGTTRGVFVINKAGKVLAAEPGSPAGTVEVVRKIVSESAKEEKNSKSDHKAAHKADHVQTAAEKKEDKAKAKVAADVADTAAKLDGDKTKS